MSSLVAIAHSYYTILYVTFVGSVVAMTVYFLVLYAIPESSGNFGTLRRFVTKLGNALLLLALVQFALVLVSHTS